jgi:hypothetical protein
VSNSKAKASGYLPVPDGIGEAILGGNLVRMLSALSPHGGSIVFFLMQRHGARYVTHDRMTARTIIICG